MIEIIIATVCVCLAIVSYYVRVNGNSSHGKLPPGPRGLPVVGHLPFIRNNAAKKFMEWKKIYGPIFSIKLAGYPAVVINDAKLIKEALNMEVFSGRPLFKLFAEISELKGIIWRDGPGMFEQRRFVVKTLKEFGIGKSSSEFRIQEEMSKFLESLEMKCEAGNGRLPIYVDKFFKFPLINSLWGVLTGHRFDESDPTVGRFLQAFQTLVHASGAVTAQLMWFFPWVASLFSFLGYKPMVTGMRSFYAHMDQEIEKLRLNYVPGHPENFTHAYFDQVAQTTDVQSCFHPSRNEQPIATGDVVSGATDTTNSIMDSLLSYMAREPEIQQKLQQEIDTIIGTSDQLKIPSLADRSQMPYTEALVQELLRITSVIPFALFHRTLADVDFHGYRIPKNTLIIPNLWGVHRDPEDWLEPEKFNPERFLDLIDGKFCKKKLTKDVLTFSFGKRGCPGEGFARDELFLFTTMFFQKFSITFADQIPPVECAFSFVMSPEPFHAILTRR